MKEILFTFDTYFHNRFKRNITMNLTSSRILITTLLLTFSLGIIAQETTESANKFSKESSASYLKSKKSVFSSDPLKSKFDAIKLIDVSYQQMTKADCDLKKGSHVYESQKLNATRRLKADVNYIPLISKEKFTLSASLRYRYEFMPFDTYGNAPWEHGLDVETHYFVGGFTFGYHNRLFGRDFDFKLKALTDASNKGFESVIGSAHISYNIVKSSNTIASIGVYGTTSQAVIFPVFPTVTFKHRFGESPLLIDFNLPYNAYFRSMIGKNGRLSAGAALDGTMAYIYPGLSLPRKPSDKPDESIVTRGTYSYHRIDIKGGVKYEHFIAKNILASVDLGVSKVYKGVLRRKNSDDNFVKLSQNANFYFNIGLAYTIGFH